MENTDIVKNLVSIIIPVYNTEEYLGYCLNSVVSQTYQHIEIILVNDGSTDNSLRICQNYATIDNRVSVISIKNSGVSNARNVGLDVAKGEYVLFLDSDDYIVCETLEELYLQAVEYDLDCIYFDAHAFFETEEARQKNPGYESYYVRNKDYTGIYDGIELFCEMCFNNDFRPSSCLQLIKREVLKENAIVFYNGIIHEDNLFSFQIMTFSHKVMYRNKAYYMRRVREGSVMTSKQSIKSAYGYYICMCETESMLEKQEFSRYEMMAVKKFLTSLQAAAMRMLDNNIDDNQFWEALNGYPPRHVMGLILWVYEAQRKIQARTGMFKKENERLKNSISYRLGLFITYIPRKTYHLGDGFIKRMKGIKFETKK